MAQPASFVGGGGDDQDRLLDEASAVVKEQAYYMKRAIDNDNAREALKHSSNVICELRTSLLSPKNYFELYMLVFQEMQHLATFFADKGRHGRKMQELYESVQHAGNILPRMYLLATVGSSYIKSREAPAKEILKDMGELCKGVQNPLRGLFLRYYLSQMVKDKLPDVGTEYEGEGGGIDDAFEFIFNNFTESNRLWVRMQHQGAAKDKAKREKERHELRSLVGTNLVRLSQLEGMTVQYYAETALPKILDHIIWVKDTMSQQYLFESMIQAFPDDFHIRTLEQILAAYTKATPAVDMKPIMVTLMNRLANYINGEGGAAATSGLDIFSMFRTHLQAILERALDPPSNQGGAPPAGNTQVDISPALEVQAAFMQFTMSLYPSRAEYVDIILQSTAEIIQKYFVRTMDSKSKLSGPAGEKIVDLLKYPLTHLSLSVLGLENYPILMSFLQFETRKQVALSMVAIVAEDARGLQSVEEVQRLFEFITPLLRDEDDTPAEEGKDKVQFMTEQQQVCKLVHKIQNENTDVEFQMLQQMRNYFGQGTPTRMVHTLQPTFYGAMGLIPKIRRREQRREQGDGSDPPQTSLKKVFQFMHKTNQALASADANIGFQLWLSAAICADQVDKTCGNPGQFEGIAYEFLTQALITFEEDINETKKQYEGIFQLVGTISAMTCLDAENLDTAVAKVAQHSSRLLKKPMQCRAIAVCTHMFWSQAQKNGKRVLECLQKCLKIADKEVGEHPSEVSLWVELLDKYIFFYEARCEEVNISFVQTLLNLCAEHISFAIADSSCTREGEKARQHMLDLLSYIKNLKASGSEDGARFQELDLSAIKL